MMSLMPNCKTGQDLNLFSYKFHVLMLDSKKLFINALFFLHIVELHKEELGFHEG